MVLSLQVNENEGPTSHYAVLGERRKDAPVVLPPEQAVLYTTVRSTVSRRTDKAGGTQVGLYDYMRIFGKQVIFQMIWCAFVASFRW